MTTEAELIEIQHQVDSLNSEQRPIFEQKMAAINDPNANKCFFLDGPGGSGKTYLLNTIIRVLKSRATIVMPFATTGIASLLMDSGRTAHSGYKLPIPATECTTSSMLLESEEADIMRRSSLHLIDEIPMLNKELLRMIDVLLRNLKHSDKPFGGIVMIGSGDFRQTSPVVRYGSRAKIIMASIKSSPLWRHFQKFSLSTNMRAHKDPAFAHMLLQIGDGTIERLASGQIQIPTDMIVEDVIGTIYGVDIKTLTADQLAERVVLASTNKAVLSMNNSIIEQLPGEARTYLSADSIVDAQDVDYERYSPQFLHQQTESGMPHHELNLKVGTIVMLLRNIQPRQGLCNGTRLRVRTLHDFFLSAEVLTGSSKGNIVFIPRLDLTPSDTELPFKLKRRQFPIIPAFAMTINKSQGQTFEHVGIYLDKPVFTHGQLYTGI